MKISSKLILIFYFLSTFNSVVLSQKDKDINVKTTAIKSGILIPVGELANSNSVGFIISDQSKWSISKYLKVLGRIEGSVYGGAMIEKRMIIGFDPINNVPVYQNISEKTNPTGIITIGSGLELSSNLKDGGHYGTIDFPSINMIISQDSEIRAGFGVGFGYKFNWGKSFFSFEFGGTIYNLFLTDSGEKTLGGLHLSFTAEF